MYRFTIWIGRATVKIISLYGPVRLKAVATLQVSVDKVL